MATCRAEQRHVIRGLLKLAQSESEHYAVSKTRSAHASSREKWSSFCREFGWDPLLQELPEADRFMALKAFGQAYRLGAGNSRNQPVTARTVSAALGHIGKMFSRLGLQDPRKEPGKDTFHAEYDEWRRGLQRKDPNAMRTYPCSLEIIRQLFNMPVTPLQEVARDLCVIGFFYLNRPGEVVATSNKDRGLSSPFRLCDIYLSFSDYVWRASTPLPARYVSHNDVLASDTASLEYTDQKNSVRGERVRHATTGHADLCPVRAIERRIQHLRRFNAPATTPLYAYFKEDGTIKQCHTQAVTSLLKAGAALAQPRTGIPPSKISARSLRPGGATALLCAGVQPTNIQLVGRWNSEAMLRYLRADATPAVHNFAKQMLSAGSFSYSPVALKPTTATLLPTQAPEYAAAHVDLSDDVEDLADELATASVIDD